MYVGYGSSSCCSRQLVPHTPVGAHNVTMMCEHLWQHRVGTTYYIGVCITSAWLHARVVRLLTLTVQHMPRAHFQNIVRGQHMRLAIFNLATLVYELHSYVWWKMSSNISQECPGYNIRIFINSVTLHGKYALLMRQIQNIELQINVWRRKTIVTAS